MIALAEFPNVEKWRAKIRDILPGVKFAIPHTTLYVRDCQGIFLSSEEDFKKMAHELDVKTLKILRDKWEGRP